MSTAVQRRRGSTLAHSTFTGLEGETTYDLTLKRLVAHDGILPGGFPAAHLHLAQTFAQSQTFAATENFFGNTTGPDSRIAFLNPVGAGTNTFDFNTNGTLNANLIRKYNTTPFQIETAASGNLDFVIDSRNVSTGTSVRFLTNGLRDSGIQTLLASFFDNGTNELTNRTTVTIPALAATTAAGYSLVNSTAAAAGAQQVSPALQFEGFGWKTIAGGASQSVRWRQFLNPVQATSEPTAELAFQVSVNAAAFTSMLTLRSTSAHTLNGSLAMNSTLTGMTGVTMADSALLFWLTRTVLSSPADGVLRLTNNAQTDWTRLAFGGTTAAFPAIGRSGTNLEILGADGAGPSGLLIYNTKTSATNFERLDIQWTANVAQIFTEKGSGGGTARDLILGTDGLARLVIEAAGTITWGGASSLETDGSILVDIASNFFSANVTSQTVVIGNQFAVDVGGNQIGFFAAVPVTQQDVIPLTNGVTPGGTADTLDDIDITLTEADLGVSTVDITTIPLKADVEARLVTIRQDFYQLGEKVNQIIAALENYGLLTP